MAEAKSKAGWKPEVFGLLHRLKPVANGESAEAD